MRIDRAPIPSRVRLGMFYGTGMATLNTIFVLLRYSSSGPGLFERNGVSIGGIVAAYYVGGILGGAVVGLLWQFLRSRLGATVTGMAAAFPGMTAITLASRGPFSQWNTTDWWGCLFGAVLIGGLTANFVWRPTRESSV